MTPAITARHVSKRFGAFTAVDGMSFDVQAGETMVLWGANGAGKTTVLRCILGVIPFDGAITILGHEVPRDGKAARRLLGYVPQELGLYGEQSVMELVAFYARLRRLPTERAMALLESWDLARCARQPVRTLSGGMKQKLALVIALLSDPPVLLLDEPASSLDVRARQELYALLERLKQAGKTMLLCSHRAGEVLKLADTVMVLERGRLLHAGTPEAVRRFVDREVMLALTVPSTQKAQAAALLTQHGFAVHLNNTQVWVSVDGARKAQPLQVLAEAGIPVLDFDVEQGRLDELPPQSV